MSCLQVLTCLAIVFCVGVAAQGEDEEWSQNYQCGEYGLSPYPYVVSLAHRRRKTGFVHTCGGTLLTQSHILTTATCFDNKLDFTMWRVRAGSLCASRSGQIRNITSVTMHPKSEPGVLADLAIVELASKLDSAVNARPAELPEEDADLHTASTPTIAGWGEDATGTPTEILNYGHVTLVGAKACALRMKKAWGLRAGIICTGEHGDGVPAPCRGDVGGPLLVDDNVVRGVIARVPAKCGVVGTDDAYVDVAMYRDWIKSVAGLP